MNSQELRQAFISYFLERDHKHVASSPLVPPDDPTLLFTTAGMVQFKPYYSGYTDPPYPRAVTIQKCMRAGGKGSDLENVGKTLRHLTFFEMLGHFSFGDYFKKEALHWAWEFSTAIAKLDPKRIYASVYEDDQEAWDIWTKEIGMPESHMVRLGKKDNFWGPAGETGACGPCSELYYDRGEKYGPNLSFQDATINDDDPGSRYLEYWNSVFPQFDQMKDGSRKPLKYRGVDTGSGFERVCCILQDKDSLFETDLLFPLVTAAASAMNLGSYNALSPEIKQSVNVAADHVRALTFVMSEGILPSNEGRGYVMRRLLRRAARYARRAGFEDPFLYKVVDSVIDTMGSVYPELSRNSSLIRKVIRSEEESYATTLGAGLSRLDSLFTRQEGGAAVIPGSDIFQLTATFGLPLDDIAEVASDRGYTLDLDSYESHVQQHRTQSRKIARGSRFEGMEDAIKTVLRKYGPTDFVGYPGFGEEMDEMLDDFDPQSEDSMQEMIDRLQSYGLLPQDLLDSDGESEDSSGEFTDNQEESELSDGYPVSVVDELEVLALFKDGGSISAVHTGDPIAIILDATPFYAESGGQVGDTGVIRSNSAIIRITDTQKTPEEIIVHFGVVEAGELHLGESVTGVIDLERRMSVMRNHTATHLLQGALKNVVGDHIAQQGSYVGPDYLRFDFTNPEGVSAEKIVEIERLVNDQIMRDVPVLSASMNLEEARKIPGIIAPFGEKYGATVRVVEIGVWDVEFCGGTHMLNTGPIGTFIITSEGAVASGVRRIEAVTGRAALELIQKDRGVLKVLSEELKIPRDRIPDRVGALQEELKSLRKQLDQIQASQGSDNAEKLLADADTASGVSIVKQHLPGLDIKQLRDIYDGLKSRKPEGLLAILATSDDSRVTVLAGATKDVVEKGISCGNLLKQIAPTIDGNGGGKPEMAQAGGKNVAAVGMALDQAHKAASEILAP